MQAVKVLLSNMLESVQLAKQHVRTINLTKLIISNMSDNGFALLQHVGIGQTTKVR